jgi:hypothetical protein
MRRCHESQSDKDYLDQFQVQKLLADALACHLSLHQTNTFDVKDKLNDIDESSIAAACSSCSSKGYIARNVHSNSSSSKSSQSSYSSPSTTSDVDDTTCSSSFHVCVHNAGTNMSANAHTSSSSFSSSVASSAGSSADDKCSSISGQLSLADSKQYTKIVKTRDAMLFFRQ